MEEKNKLEKQPISKEYALLGSEDSINFGRKKS